jgi:hypothetical protein
MKTINPGLKLRKWALAAIAPLVMLAACQNDDELLPQPKPTDKCAARGDTTIVVSRAQDMQSRLELANEYVNCGKDVVCDVDFPLGLSKDDLKNGNHWISSGNFKVIFGTNGYVYANEDNTLLKSDVWAKFGKFKIGAGPDNQKFAVNKEEEAQFGPYSAYLRVLDGTAAETAEEMEEAAGEAAGATEPTTVYVADIVPATESLVSSLEAAVANSNVSFEALGSGSGIQTTAAKMDISKQFLEKVPLIEGEVQTGKSFPVNYWYVRDLTRAEAQTLAPGMILRTNNMGSISNLTAQYASLPNTTMAMGANSAQSSGQSGGLIPDTVVLENDLEDLTSLVALADYPYTIMVNIAPMPDVPGGYARVGNVTDEVMSINSTSDVPNSGNPLQFTRTPTFGATGNRYVAYPGPVEDKVRLTKLEYGNGTSRSGEKLASSLNQVRTNNTSHVLDTPIFEQANVDIGLSKDASITNPEDIKQYQQTIIPAGTGTYISWGSVCNIADGIGNPFGLGDGDPNIWLNLDSRTTILDLTVADSIAIFNGVVDENPTVQANLRDKVLQDWLALMHIQIKNKIVDNNDQGVWQDGLGGRWSMVVRMPSQITANQVVESSRAGSGKSYDKSEHEKRMGEKYRAAAAAKAQTTKINSKINGK